MRFLREKLGIGVTDEGLIPPEQADEMLRRLVEE